MRWRWITIAVALCMLTLVSAAPLLAAGPEAIEVLGSGTFETNCSGTLTSGCAATASGQMAGTPILSGTFIVRIDTGSPASFNVNQGICLPAAWRGRLTDAGGDTIDFTHAGWICEEGVAGSPFLYAGTFRITGGTGRYASAAGTGSVSVTFIRGAGTASLPTGTGTSSVHLRGTITY